jgi:hypothetical protein
VVTRPGRSTRIRRAGLLHGLPGRRLRRPGSLITEPGCSADVP